MTNRISPAFNKRSPPSTCAIYSPFIQRSFDQIMHDVAISSLPVVFCVDRAGVVGSDGATHQGVFDIAMLRPLPNLTIAQPKDDCIFFMQMPATTKMGQT